MRSFLITFAPFGSVALTALFSVIALFLLTRWMGVRQVNQLTTFDYINGITIGSIASDAAQAGSFQEFMICLICVVIYAVATVFVAWVDNKSIHLRRMCSGRAVILMKDGILLDENFKKQRLDVNEFLMMCRAKGFFDISSIHAAVLEENGSLSILPKSDQRPVQPCDLQINPTVENLCANVIIDGRMMLENLKDYGRNADWLNKQLKQMQVQQKEVFLATLTTDFQLALYLRGGEQKHNGLS